MKKAILAALLLLVANCSYSQSTRLQDVKETYDSNMNYTPGYDSQGSYQRDNSRFYYKKDNPPDPERPIKDYDPQGPSRHTDDYPYSDSNMNYSPGYDSGGGYERRNFPSR